MTCRKYVVFNRCRGRFSSFMSQNFSKEHITNRKRVSLLKFTSKPFILNNFIPCFILIFSFHVRNPISSVSGTAFNGALEYLENNERDLLTVKDLRRYVQETNE